VNTKDVGNELEDFLEGLEAACQEQVSWRGDQMRLELTTYLTDCPGPDLLVSSGRCIVLARNSVLLMTNPSGIHILPGGRREPGEAVLDTTIREIAEETGLTIDPPQHIGILAFRHLTPKPVVYPYPYPVFVNAVFAARLPNIPDVAVDDTYELAGQFIDIDAARSEVPIHQQVLLDAALASLAVPSSVSRIAP
jgi:8-oxo-dGTP pyrophosphatase MutT (NUDIX family)